MGECYPQWVAPIEMERSPAPGVSPFSSSGHPHRAEILPRHPRDVGDGNLLRAHRFTLALVGAAPEAFGVGLVDHGDDPPVALDLALRQQRQMRDLRAREEVRRAVLARR